MRYYKLLGMLVVIAFALVGSGMCFEKTTQVATTMGPDPVIAAGNYNGELVLPAETDWVGGYTEIDASHPVGGMALYTDYTIAGHGNNSSSIWTYGQIPLEDLKNGIEIEIPPCGCGAMG